MSYVCPHIPLSLLLFCYFSHAACTQITMHGFSFQLIFPKWEQKWVFSLLPGGTLSGAVVDLRRWQPRCVFSGQGAVRYSVWHTLSSSWDRPKSTLATRAQFYPHVHTPTAWSRSEAASWQGYRVQFLQYVLLRITGSKQSSTATSFTDSTGRYLTTNTYSGTENAENSASSCYIKAGHGYQNTEREKQKQHRQGVHVCVHMGVKYNFTLAWLLEPQSKSDVAVSGKFTQSYERQYRSNWKQE